MAKIEHSRKKERLKGITRVKEKRRSKLKQQVSGKKKKLVRRRIKWKEQMSHCNWLLIISLFVIFGGKICYSLFTCIYSMLGIYSVTNSFIFSIHQRIDSAIQPFLSAFNMVSEQVF